MEESPSQGRRSIDRNAPSGYSAGVPQQASPSVIDRAFAILEACAQSDRSVSLSELSALTGLPKATLHRMCWKLESLSALEHHAGGFRIGAKLLALGAINPAVQRLRTQSAPFLYEVNSETGLGGSLAILHADGALLLDEVYSSKKRPVRMVGRILPLHATAIGKALVAGEPPERRKALVDRIPMTRFTKHTITDRDVLLDQLAVAAETGVAYSRSEFRLGAVAVAAPIISSGTTVGALGLVGVRKPSEATSYALTVARAAEGISLSLHTPVVRQNQAPEPS
jgi:IclR family transcriptional regulator, acetate operon repressor